MRTWSALCRLWLSSLSGRRPLYASRFTRAGRLDHFAMTEQSFPGTLAQALGSSLILSGSKVLLTDGVYQGRFTCTLDGATVQPLSGSPLIDGCIYSDGDSTLIQGLRITDSTFVDRVSSTPARLPPTFSPGRPPAFGAGGRISSSGIASSMIAPREHTARTRPPVSTMAALYSSMGGTLPTGAMVTAFMDR